MPPSDLSGGNASKSDLESAANKLVLGVRELVREELQRPATLPAQDELPTWGDAAWLLIFICNVALLFSLVPRLNSQIEFIFKLAPWLFGGLFVVANAWFRDRLLEISRLRWFRASQAALLFLAIALPHARIIPIKVAVHPANADLTIDKIPEDYDKVIWLSLWNHAVTISKDKNDDVAADNREFKLGWWEMIPAVLSKEMAPDWALIYPLDIDTSEVTNEKCSILITRSGPFDRDFLDPENLRSYGMTKISIDVIKYTSKGSSRTYLPFGKYAMKIDREECSPEEVDVENKASNYHSFSRCQK
jgi:hypothetical protein